MDQTFSPRTEAAKAAKTKLSQLDFLVARSQLQPDASPFLGLALSIEKLPEARTALRALSDWRLERLLSDFGHAISWAICATLSEHYGEDGNARVWPFVEDLLGRAIPVGGDRKLISEAFVRACRKLGLASSGFDKDVHAFQIHAGVSRAQLHHLAKAFIAQEASLGLPDKDDIVILNRWEDDALHFLDPGIQVLQRPILMDHSAWMAAAYVDFRQDNNSLSGRTSYLRAFGDSISEAQNGSGAISGRVAAIPRLIWDDGRPQIAVPGQSNRFKLRVDGDVIRVRPGRNWTLPNPLPKIIAWDGEYPGRIELFRNSDFIVFDRNTGRQAEVTSREYSGQTRLSVFVATGVVISTKAFLVDGEPVRELAPGLFGSDVDLRSGAIELSVGGSTWPLRGVRRPQISIHSQPIGKGLGGASLWGPDATVELDFGASELIMGDGSVRERKGYVEVTAEGYSFPVEVDVDRLGIASVTLAHLAEMAGVSMERGPCSITVTLLRSSNETGTRIATRYKRRMNVWPGFVSQVGLCFNAKSSPDNFVPTESRHVSKDDSGTICLDRHGGYSLARAAFEIDGKVKLFELRPNGLIGVLERIDGTALPWRMGDVIVKGSSTRSDALVLRSPDASARLRIGSRLVPDPFVDGPTYAIPIATLDGGDIVHLSREGLPTLVASVESAIEPLEIRLRCWQGGARLVLQMPFKLGGVALELETEDGDLDRSEISLDHIPAARRAQFWVKSHEVDGERVAIDLEGKGLSGLSLVRIKVRAVLESDWFQLSNARNDHYAVPLVGVEEPGCDPKHLEKIETWLSTCYAREVWEQGIGSLLETRWTELIHCIRDRPDGLERLLLQALRDDEPDWLPMLHIVQRVPELFAAPSVKFHQFSNSEGDERILRLVADASVTRLRELSIHPIAMCAFQNLRSASAAGDKLKNFQPGQLRGILSTQVDKPGLWMGTDALGPDHAATALDLLRDRVETHEVLGAGEAEGRMSLRSARLNRIATLWKDKAIADRLLSSGDDEDQSIHLIEQALVAFAVASRKGPEAVRLLLARAAHDLDESEASVLASLGEMIRLGRELFMFHLIAAELEIRSAA